MARLRWLSCVLLSAGCAGPAAHECCSCTKDASPKSAVAPATIVIPAVAQAPAGEAPLRVEQFEDGSLKMADVPSHQLEVFLRDLNRRRDYDYSQHAEQPGPNNEYLTRWIQKSNAELIHRGYSYDSGGELHAPDNMIIPTR